MKEEMICKICGGSRIKSKGQIINGKYPKEFLEDYSLCECKRCGLNFIYPTPSDEALDFIYSDQAYDAQWGISDKKSKIKGIRHLNFEYYSDVIKKFILKGKVLDCGCASGTFLDVMKQCGFDCYGVETSKPPFLIANKKHPKKIFKANIEDLEIQKGFFDIITMFDFIEHVKDPGKVLKKAKDLLAPGGYLIIVTPDTNSLSASILGKHHNDYIMEHLNLFNRKNVRYFLKKNGFSTLKIESAKKIVNLDFVEKVFQRHTNFLYYPINFINKLIPEKVSHYPIKLSFGGMLVTAKKI